MRIRQYTYFGIGSEVMSAVEMSDRLGMAPDEYLVRGSRRQRDPVVPRSHSWKIVGKEPGLCVVLQFLERTGAELDVDEYG